MSSTNLWPTGSPVGPTPAREGSAGPPAPVVLVARSNVRGLTAARRAAAGWAAGGVAGVEVLGLAVVADAPGKLPRPLEDLTAPVAGGVPRVWRLPWVEGWRTGEEVRLDAAPKEFRRLVQDVRALVPTLAAIRGTR